MPVAAMPPRAKCLGVEFIEFAVDEISRRGVRGAARRARLPEGRRAQIQVGHALAAGRHQIVVNTEKEGFAHAFNITHGTSVCAIGLKVDDAHATLDRAQKLHDQPFQQAVGPGELEIPAVRGLGGSLVYFLDPKSELGRVWSIEFDDTGEGGVRRWRLDRGRPISQSMHYERDADLVLFYMSLLDVTKTAVEDVTDPRGIVRSQVVQTPDGTLRIVLNASQAQGTQSSRFLTETFGSGVQHIAFGTDDIVATVAKLAANGVKLLPIPENYYDDLEAKTDLKPERIEALRAHNILYDRDGDGEYLQAYTQSFEDRFFFEIVERRGYRGFGAANAPIRLAAQTQLARHPAIPRR